MTDLKGKKVLVIGAGKSGIAASGLLMRKGAEVVLFDANEKKDRDEIRSKLPADFSGRIETGTLSEEARKETELLVISPGVPIDCSMVMEFKKKGIPVWGEIELASNYGKGTVIAITGTNGKTTTTTLVGEILKKQFDSVFVVGNIGNPYTDFADQTTEDSRIAAEISSFQLETIHEFHPHVSAILNITPDHMNRHHTMECYVNVKLSITKNQGPEDYCVLNYEDPLLRERAGEIRAQVIWFSSATRLENGICMDGEDIVLMEDGRETRLINIHDFNLLGTHNYENIMAAIAMTRAAGVPMDKILAAVRVFKAVEHRIEYVETINGVKYYNDSKGTNPDAAIRGIRAMLTPTYLIGGGYDKGSTYDEWIEAFDGKVKKLVLLGATADAIEACARSHGFTDIVRVATLEEAVAYCAKEAKAGESVLLSPACASWDMFESYEQRGHIFKDLVRGMMKQ